MKKLAIGVLSACALAVAGGLATSYYIGGKVQESIEHTADTWSSEDGFTVRVLDYQRGLLSSKAQTLWSFSSEDEPYDITVTHDILHGPWPMGKAAKVVSQFLLPDDSDPLLLEALQKRAPLEWTVTADWSGETVHTMFSPNFSTNFEDASSLTWGGLQAEWTLSAAHDRTQGFVRMPLLRVKVEDGSRMDMEDTEITFDTHSPEGYSFWVGPTVVKLGLLAVQDAESDAQLKLHQLQLTATNTLQDNLVQSGLDAHLEQIAANTYSIENLALQMHFNNINATWLDQLMQWMQAGSDVQDMTWLRSLPLLLAGKPELAITRLSMQSADGPIALSARIAYTGTNPEAFNPGTDLEGQLSTSMPVSAMTQLLESKVRNDYLQLLEQMELDLDESELQASIDAGIEKRLKILLEQGVLQKKGDMLDATLIFSGGAFNLNNRSQSLQQLLGIGSAM